MSVHTREALLARLADGELHSGPVLAAELGVSRTAVWKLVTELRERGIEVASAERRGYRLSRAVELLDAGIIRAAALDAGQPLAADLEVLFEVASTNDYLYAAPAPPAGRPRLAFAEIQHAGRGRRGRSWLAPFGSGLTFSVAWSFRDYPADLSALSLAIGVVIAESLQAAGAAGTMLKWPNDIVWRQRKLGGLLIQLRSEVGGAGSVVVGLGLNLDLPREAREALAIPGATPVADLGEACGGRQPGRNQLAARLAGAILDGLDRFGQAGFVPFAARWQSLDALAGSKVRVARSDGVVEGRALGVDHDGALRVEVQGRVERVYSGDVSVRPAAGGP